MTHQEAKALLEQLRAGYNTPSTANALAVAIVALSSPELDWIPNRGTKPDCTLCHVRLIDGDTIVGKTSNWKWDKNSIITHYIPIPAPPEFKERRLFVIEQGESGLWSVCNTKQYGSVARGILSKEQAQELADFYEKMYLASTYR